MDLPNVMKAGLDDLIPVIIIIAVIITRIVKASKQGRPLTPPPPPGERPAREPQAPSPEPADELRQFLEALSGVPQQRPSTPQSSPLQAGLRAVTQPPSPPPVNRTALKIPPLMPAPPTPKVKPKPPRKRRHWEQEPPKPRPMVVEECDLSPLRKALDEHLSDRQSLRGAWLLREVLGPPVGLRQ